jgi:putative tryptophan/tyrosine transport system substrate-binding protein
LDLGSSLAAFRRGLAEQDFVEGRNVEVLYRLADTQYDRLPALAVDLVRRRVAVIVACASVNAALAAKAATPTIPIVFEVPADPVELGLVESLNRPGGNVTGATFLTQALIAKRLELLHETVPAARSIGYLVNPANSGTVSRIREAEVALRTLGVRSVILNAGTPAKSMQLSKPLLGSALVPLWWIPTPC